MEAVSTPVGYPAWQNLKVGVSIASLGSYSTTESYSMVAYLNFGGGFKFEV